MSPLPTGLKQKGDGRPVYKKFEGLDRFPVSLSCFKSQKFMVGTDVKGLYTNMYVIHYNKTYEILNLYLVLHI